VCVVVVDVADLLALLQAMHMPIGIAEYDDAVRALLAEAGTVVERWASRVRVTN
jgi:hypothetical protein